MRNYSLLRKDHLISNTHLKGSAKLDAFFIPKWHVNQGISGHNQQPNLPRPKCNLEIDSYLPYYYDSKTALSK